MGLGFFQFAHQLPFFICQISSESRLTCAHEVSLGGLFLELAIFLISAQTHLLLKCSVKNIQVDFGDLQRVFHQVWVTFVKKRPTKKEFMIFGGKLKDLQFDVNRWKWNRAIDLLKYNSKNGCKWLKPCESLEKKCKENGKIVSPTK